MGTRNKVGMTACVTFRFILGRWFRPILTEMPTPFQPLIWLNFLVFITKLTSSTDRNSRLGGKKSSGDCCKVLRCWLRDSIPDNI